MAGNARDGRVLVTLSGVANVARNLLVFSFQGEVGLVMIVLNIVPRNSLMATATLFSQSALMGIVIIVARMTCARGLCICLAAIMAGITGSLEVRVL